MELINHNNRVPFTRIDTLQSQWHQLIITADHTIRLLKIKTNVYCDADHDFFYYRTN